MKILCAIYNPEIVKTVQNVVSFNFLTCKMRIIVLDTVAKKDYVAVIYFVL